MRRFLPAALLLAASLPLFGGVTYTMQSVSTGMTAATITGTVQVEGQHLRMDFSSGDGMVFKDNAILLTADGGKTLQVYDPSAKTYFELPVDQLLGSTTAALQSLGSMMKITFDNPKVSAKSLGDGGTIEGYPTQKSQLDAAFDINLDMAGQKMTTHMSLLTERWTTDKLSAAMMNVFQSQGIRTGVDAVDKLIEAQKSLGNGFPLKQVSTVHVQQGGADLVANTTTTVTNIQTKAIPADHFTPPTGYTKTENPMERMMKGLAK